MTDQAAAQQEKKGQFAIQRIFTKDVSFESPNSPEIFRGQWKPQVNMDLNTRSNKLDENIYEVVLTITVTAKNEDKTAFLAEVQQGGIFQIDGLEGPALHQTLGAFCPNLLFPYAREAVDGLVTKGSFPALMLAPVNFEAIYAQNLQKKQEEAQAEATH
ncbi:protein-export chaperone SecB [Oceaniserpentilla sp. 4NH20-0058]|uniref:protein-export chaperone SecB n=1 Tax=Oceaniserpentilla sp. 4NH20-0058 TaxID=3127660 RepID=UPI0031083CAE